MEKLHHGGRLPEAGAAPRPGTVADLGAATTGDGRAARSWSWLVLGLVLAAIVFRLGAFAFALRHAPLSSDEAWPSLMALHILKGEFPVVYWGQNYMGTQESFFDAATIAAFGAETWAIRLYPLLVSFLYLGVTVWLAARVFGRTTALITLALLVVPVPYLAMCGAVVPPDNYLAVTTLAGLALVLTHDLLGRPPAAGATLARYALLGFVLGFTFWLHIIVISAIGVCGLVLWLSDKRWPLRLSFWVFGAAFLLGALPLVLFNLHHHFATFADVGRTATPARSWELFKGAFGVTFGFLTGTRVMLYPDNSHWLPIPGKLTWVVSAIWIFALGAATVRHLGAHLRLAVLSIRREAAAPLLTLAGAAALFAFCRSSRSGWHDVRYLLPAMAVLPVLLAEGLRLLGRTERLVRVALLAVLVGTQVWGSVIFARAWRDPKIMGVDLELPDTRALQAFLAEHGICRAYAHYWLSYRLTVETKERLICAEPYNERFPGNPVEFLTEVDASTNVAFIQHPTLRFCDDFGALVRLAGGACRTATVGVFTVYYDFQPPAAEAVDGSRPSHDLPREAWRVTASHGTNEIGQMVDGSLATRWATHAPQAAGMWVEVDLGATHALDQVQLYSGQWIADRPRGYALQLSRDGCAWQTVKRGNGMETILPWRNGHPVWPSPEEPLRLSFPPQAARYVRLELTARHPVLDWSIAELRMRGPSARGAP